jgi:glycosyltransferase involved in cell wall biosynthesis
MKFSFIIPAYNEENYIFDSLDAIFQMDGLKRLPFFEVIVVNNASTDKTEEIIRQNFPAVKILAENRKGVTIARNKGGFEAKGDFIVFFDADVRPPRDWLKKTVRYLNKHSDAVALSGPYHYEGLSFLQNAFVKGFYNVMPFFGEIIISTLLKKGGIMQGGNIVVKKDIFVKVGGFDEKIDFWGDEALLAKKLVQYGKIKFIKSLWVESSSRRLKREGLILTASRGVINCVWPVISGEPFTKEHKDIRE